MSTLLPSVKGKSWVFQVTALCVVLGALLGLSLKTQKQVMKSGMPDRLPALRAAFRDTKEINDKLKKERDDYRNLSEKYAKQLAEGTPRSENLVKAISEAKLVAGLVPVQGPGITVTVIDSPQMAGADPAARDQYMVHAQDVLLLVNELFDAGAEAIAVNDQRVMATTPIRCGGVPVLVNMVKLAPPYKIKAIGDPDALDYAAKMKGGVADQIGLALLDMITVKKEPTLNVPAYTGTTRFTYAKPVAEGARND